MAAELADGLKFSMTDDEFLDFIKGIDGNITIETGEIFDELKNFTETGYKYFLIKSVN